jgi:predicted DsbA family dithiol-disulfide isomerase
VLASTSQAVSIGITGVPGFLLDRRLLVLGAQPQEVFERAFQQLSEPPQDP